MTNLQSHADGTLGEDESRWLVRRAEGGFGVIETCAAHVARDGQSWVGELGIFDDAQLPGLGVLASQIVAHDAVGMVQLFHGGVRANPEVSGMEAWSASAIEEDSVAARAGTEQDILAVIEHFRDAAVRAHRAGFQGVELHGAHGYLFSQFLSTTANRRTDGWGGSLENRARLLRETILAIRRAVPASFVVGVRLSPEDWGHAKGIDLDDTLELARMLVRDNIDFIHLSLWDTRNNTSKRPDLHPVPLFVQAIRDSVPIIVAGKVWTREDGEGLLAMGASGVALGQAAIAHPDWPRRVLDPGWVPRRPPFTLEELVDRGLSPGFARNMSVWWPGFVRD